MFILIKKNRFQLNNIFHDKQNRKEMGDRNIEDALMGNK